LLRKVLAPIHRDGWRFIASRPARTPWAGLGLLAALVAFLRQARPALVITAMPMANVLFSLAATLARSGTRVILSHHTPSFTYQRLLNRVDRWTGRLSPVVGVVSVSDAVGASFADWPRGYRARQRTIHNALPERIETLIDTITAGQMRDRARHRLVVAVGRLSHQKNYPQLIQAMALLPDARLEIIGAGEDEAALRRLIADLDVGQRVALLGQMSREETLRRVAQADVFVQVSLFEGHSLALIEAARLGLPMVVSDVPVQVEGVTGARGELCGITVPLGDAPALAGALAGLLDDPAAYRHWAGKAAGLGAIRSSRALIDAYADLLTSHGLVPREGTMS